VYGYWRDGKGKGKRKIRAVWCGVFIILKIFDRGRYSLIVSDGLRGLWIDGSRWSCYGVSWGCEEKGNWD